MRHSKPDDIPEDVWAYAEAVESFWRELPPASAVELHARAILAERERCATYIEQRPGRIPDRQEIAAAIRNGTNRQGNSA